MNQQKTHKKIKQEINKKDGKVLLIGCGTSLLDVPISKIQKLNKSHFTVGMSYACHLALNYDLTLSNLQVKVCLILYETDRDGIFFLFLKNIIKRNKILST